MEVKRNKSFPGKRTKQASNEITSLLQIYGNSYYTMFSRYKAVIASTQPVSGNIVKRYKPLKFPHQTTYLSREIGSRILRTIMH